jgi:gas vesicle protein
LSNYCLPNLKKENRMNDMKRERENGTENALSILAALLVGILVGSGTMLMLAPQSGKRTRAKIQQKSIELRDQATDAIEDVVELTGIKVRKIRSDLRKQAKELGQSGQALLDEQKLRISTLVESGQSAVAGTKA